MKREDLIQILKSEERRMYRLASIFKDAGPEAGVFEQVALTYAQLREQLLLK